MDSGTLLNQSLEEKCMKSTILNLIAVAALLFSWTVHAADEMTQKTQPAAAQPAAAATAAPAAAAPVTAVPAAEKQLQPPVKHSKLSKHANAKQGRSHDLDLRHCLDLESNAAIAKCAGE
jgi:hypothetical protein